MRGKFITIEGTEGVGKTTNIEYIKQWLENNGISYVNTREPGGTPFAEEIRQVLLANREEKVCSKAELLMMFAGRAQHIDQVIEPQLAQGNWVLCDRFTDATYAYQGEGRHLGSDKVTFLEDFVQKNLQPDLTIILDVPVDISLRRIKQRGDLDRFEIESSLFFERVRKAYHKRIECAPNRYFLVDASRPLKDVQTDIKNILNNFLKNQAK